MSEVELYLRLGFTHITDWAGYDHMLFLLALCGAYTLGEWRKILILVTAFTLGHSLTLALTALEILHVSATLVEMLIPLTILLTATANLLQRAAATRKLTLLRYPMALIFGLIHGLGFSSYFRSLLGHEANILKPLLFFNLGIEVGQICIVALILALAWAVMGPMRLPSKWWRLGISVLAVGLAIWMMVNRA